MISAFISPIEYSGWMAQIKDSRAKANHTVNGTLSGTEGPGDERHVQTKIRTDSPNASDRIAAV